jgi:hypothetical protein
MQVLQQVYWEKMRDCEFYDTAFSTGTFNSCEYDLHTGMMFNDCLYPPVSQYYCALRLRDMFVAITIKNRITLQYRLIFLQHQEFLDYRIHRIFLARQFLFRNGKQ